MTRCPERDSHGNQCNREIGHGGNHESTSYEREKMSEPLCGNCHWWCRAFDAVKGRRVCVLHTGLAGSGEALISNRSLQANSDH